MTSPVGLTVLIVAAVAILAWVLRSFSSSHDESAMTAGPRDAADEAADDAADDSNDGEAVAITTEGVAFLPDGDSVQLVPPGEDDDPGHLSEKSDAVFPLGKSPVNPRTGKTLRQWVPGDAFTPGDLIAARVRRGAPSVDPWRLEALGRDYEFQSWGFETEDGARAALQLVEHRIVRAPRDEHGDPIPVGDEDFVVARRKAEETEAELAMEPGPDDEDELR